MDIINNLLHSLFDMKIKLVKVFVWLSPCWSCCCYLVDVRDQGSKMTGWEREWVWVCENDEIRASLISIILSIKGMGGKGIKSSQAETTDISHHCCVSAKTDLKCYNKRIYEYHYISLLKPIFWKLNWFLDHDVVLILGVLAVSVILTLIIKLLVSMALKHKTATSST